VIVAAFTIATSMVLVGQVYSDIGSISGIVVNGSQGGVPCANTEVVLRLRIDGQFVPVAETVSDAQGQFQFQNLPIGADCLYLPGANRDDVHYPGPRVQLTIARSDVAVKLQVHDSVADPNPLVIKRHDITIQPQAGALKVTECMLVHNPTSLTYVGRAEGDEAAPVTLRLGIPSNFDRTTFHKEFFGRRFSLDDGKLATTIPWTPGERELKFTYTLCNEEKYHRWQRPLDLPCDHVRVRVDFDKPEEVSCNLASTSEKRTGRMTFESRGTTLPAGYLVRVELGDLPMSWMAYARRAALAILIGSIVVASVVIVSKQRRAVASTDAANPPTQKSKRRPMSPPTRQRASRRNRQGSLCK
jgi:hypothetical protein